MSTENSNTNESNKSVSYFNGYLNLKIQIKTLHWLI